MKKKSEIYEIVGKLEIERNKGISAYEVSESLEMDRANVSRYLNELVKEKKLRKSKTRPVLFYVEGLERKKNNLTFDKLLKSSESLKYPISQAKAAILYPPNGLHTLITGETGVGKSLFAELMFKFAKTSGVIKLKAPFIHFNCADYSENPQLLIAQIFGVKKGAYTGASETKEGLLSRADKGFLFLDEVHRLSAQGQEMLFTYIDKGYFRKLGETSKKEEVSVRLILATTESVDGYLLKTFQRRIPMIIELSPLRERSLKERYYLIRKFISLEAIQIGKKIYIEKNSLKSFLLYECLNNIGQLKSDIKLSVARAFLKYKSDNVDYIYISQSELSYHIKKGIMKLKDKRKEIDLLLDDVEEVLEFDHNDEIIKNDVKLSNNKFYTVVEEKIESLKKSGMSVNDINKILNLDINKYFKKYIKDLSTEIESKKKYNVIDKEIDILAKKMLNYAEKKLDKTYKEEIYFSLALHLNSTIKRLKKGKLVYYPELNKVRKNYSKEFLVSMELANMIDEYFNITVPLDEVGYLTMFLVSDIKLRKEINKNDVKVIVLMHGNTTATSMVQVVKDLINSKNILGLNMPLTLKPQEFYNYVKDEIKPLNIEKGLLLLVDMGSLVNFGKLLEEELKLSIKTIDQVSTALALSAARKADMGLSLDEIYKSISKNKILSFNYGNLSDKEDIIISACFTGKGSSDKIKDYIISNLNKKIKIETINLIDKVTFHRRLMKFKETYNIKAIISTIDLEISEFPVINAMDILTGYGMKKLNKIIYGNNYEIIPERLKDHLFIDNSELLVKDVINFIENVEKKLNFNIISDVKTGIILHIVFLIDNLVKKEPIERNSDNIDFFKKNNEKDIKKISYIIKPLEEKYNISISVEEKVYILKMFKKNSL